MGNQVYFESFYNWCIMNPEYGIRLLEEWSYTKNVGIQIENIARSTHKKVWWRCCDCNFEWDATVHNRVSRHSGCPKCKRNYKTSYPEQFIYNYMKIALNRAVVYNRKLIGGYEFDIDIEDMHNKKTQHILIEYGSNYYHSYVSNRQMQDRKKEEYAVNIGAIYIQILEDYNCTGVEIIGNRIRIGRRGNFDDTLTIVCESILSMIGRKNVVANISKVRGMTGISLSAKTRIEDSLYAKCNNERIIEELDIEKSGFNAKSIAANSHRTAWWSCLACGYSWKAKVCDRYISNTGCPACSNKVVIQGRNDLLSQVPRLAREFNEKLNGMKADETYYKKVKRMWWTCPKCNHTWQASCYSRVTRNSGCPSCKHNWNHDK